MPVTTDGPGPYAPPAAIYDLIERYRERGMQTPFTPDVLSRAGVADTLINRVSQTLRILDLIDEEGNPTLAMEGIRRATTEDFQKCLAEWLRAAYAEVFQYVDPSKDGAERIRDAFRSYQPTGQQPRMVTLFLTLCEKAGIRASNEEQRAPRTRPTRRQGAVQRVERRRDDVRSRGEAAPTSLPAPISGLLSSLPSNRRWTKQRRDDFIATFQAVLDFCIEVRDEEASDDDQEVSSS